MTERRNDPGDSTLTPPPGLQLLGGDTAMGVCVDGVCAMPSAPGSDEKSG